MAETTTIDRTALDVLLETTGGDPEFLAELIDAYFEDTDTLLETMQSAIETENANDLRRAAHTLKSNSANFGAMRLSALSKELEEKGKVGTFEGASELVMQIETEYARVKPELEAVRSAV